MNAQKLGLKFLCFLNYRSNTLTPCTSHFKYILPFQTGRRVCNLFTSSSFIKCLPSLSTVTYGANKKTILVSSSKEKENANKRQLTGILCDTFNFSEDGAKQIVKSWALHSHDFALGSVNLLIRLGLDKATLIRYPWLINIHPEDLEERLRTLEKAYQELGDINTSAALLKLSNDKLTDLTTTWKEEAAGSEFPSKFHFLKTMLEISLSDVMYMVDLRPFLLTLSYKTLKERVSLCIDAGAQKDDMIKDFNVVRTITSKLKSRIDILRQREVPCKPWLLYTPQTAFENYLDEYQKMRSDMEGHPTVESFLAARLKCDVNQIEKMIAKHAGVKRVSVGKLKVILDYLLIEKGIDPKLIIMRPEILRHKLETVKERIERLEALGIKFLSLWIISGRDQVFEDYVKRWGPDEKAHEEVRRE